MQWTEERVQILKRLWEQGRTARQIAEVMGNGLTRNAVIGKANRMGLRTPAARKADAAPPEEAQGRGCQWPNGHPGAPGFHFCGAPRKQGRPYCEEHCAIAYRRIPVGGGESRSSGASS